MHVYTHTYMHSSNNRNRTPGVEIELSGNLFLRIKQLPMFPFWALFKKLVPETEDIITEGAKLFPPGAPE